MKTVCTAAYGHGELPVVLTGDQPLWHREVIDERNER